MVQQEQGASSPEERKREKVIKTGGKTGVL